MDGQHCKERVKNKVSILGVIELWGDGRDIPIDQGSYYQICGMWYYVSLFEDLLAIKVMLKYLLFLNEN